MASLPVSFVFGATGLVGSHLVTALLGHEAFGTVHTITRRPPKQADTPKLDAIVETDNHKWVARLQEELARGTTTTTTTTSAAAASDAASPAVVFSALGTTHNAPGGIANQWRIDHDLNIELARAAKAAGVRTYVFVSSAGTRSLLARNLQYSRMKNGVEDALKELAFEHTIVLKPGMILGKREVEHLGGMPLKALVHGTGYIAAGLKDRFGQDADVIGKAAVHAAQLAAEGKAPAAYWELGGTDIVRLGRDEWTVRQEEEKK
ncbi:NAD(P)-binding domain protein [Niveomyces insectorum RCEF 264]|uniref:NAD(P)-binding domain protein n=1 Tax=Niveomyces insectorum RCEF 264 TaxID=1081102 RepID=A0A167TXR2_9HYPO|nr:NAD(P)-binding domain protein [Niveomyces insectorum RCEF 264]